MKAQSAVFVNAQKPLTVFGIPPVLLALLVGGAAPLYAVAIIIGWTPLALPLMLAAFAIGASVVLKRVRADLHYANLLTLAPQPWRGRSARRMLAGTSSLGGRA
jgi:hypothetical protein